MSAGEWFGIGVIVLVIVGGLLLLNQITKPYDVKNEDEFEKRRKEGAGVMTAANGFAAVSGPVRKESS